MRQVKGTLERYIRILEALAPAPAGLTLNDIIAATDLPRGTAHRLVRALAEAGLLTSLPGRAKAYVLGARLQRLLYSGVSLDLVVAMSRPLLEDLANEFGETALLARLNGGQIEKVAVWMPGHGRYSYIQPSRIMPIHATASAKAIFAYQDRKFIDNALSQRLTRYTATTKTSKAAVRKELMQVKRDGYAVCSDEFDAGVLSYACPVHLADFGTLFSIAIVGLSDRLKQHPLSRVLVALREKCDALSLALYSRTKGPDFSLENHESGGSNTSRPSFNDNPRGTGSHSALRTN